ncbi:hypothetical protein Gogos_011860, partial [Gossypium gossypioides]|nr:hypothetical protein [Gossypium gossypioides]
AVKHGARLSFAGGVLKDQNKEWILRILDGLVLCQKQGLKRVVIHADSLEEGIQVFDEVPPEVIDVLNVDTTNFDSLLSTLM